MLTAMKPLCRFARVFLLSAAMRFAEVFAMGGKRSRERNNNWMVRLKENGVSVRVAWRIYETSTPRQPRHRNPHFSLPNSPTLQWPTMLRRISKNVAVLDAFPKVEVENQQRSDKGGMLTILLTLILLLLTLAELRDYRKLNHTYEFLVDQHIDSKIQINVDLTIAMQCNALSVNVLDVAGERLYLTQNLHIVPTSFEIGRARPLGAGRQRELNIRRILKAARMNKAPDSTTIGSGDDGACRILGSFEVNKVNGNLHITSLGHGYTINFTHRIDEFSFGPLYPSINNPLDDSVEISNTHFEAFQYFISVVSFPIHEHHWLSSVAPISCFFQLPLLTSISAILTPRCTQVPTIYIDNADNTLMTNQYSVTDYRKTFDHENSRGMIPVRDRSYLCPHHRASPDLPVFHRPPLWHPWRRFRYRRLRVPRPAVHHRLTEGKAGADRGRRRVHPDLEL
ncbi:endoplasmic reticulum-golgi intermediate compartment-domain-containing protein [Jimgerdemannia flammicorona]|uniref:Endoplasmic reticulum-golgi intermediate compartment-domain-containing protein n=1 Tax=Jimgerdemannia flammicorona TaxID=994334 RepID=A0A433QSJ7_9FUNG|nr:endoplasmic reticulum-golgi intermediate compartment-domain-containing protein [Jimgerdemannia flammicorona]